MSECITGVAILTHKGALWALPSPNRHHHLFALAAFQGHNPEPGEQGFTTNFGRFVGRCDALHIAKAAGQPIRKNGETDKLYSEDLW